MTILNRRLELDEEGLKYEADPRHQEVIRKAMKLDGANGVGSPGVKDSGRSEDPLEEKMTPLEATAYRAVAARSNYLGQD